MYRIILYGSVLGILASSCNKQSGNKAEQLEALKKEQTALNSKIESLEKELAANGTITNPAQATAQVTILPLKKETFAHYVEVQGKVDADQNVNVASKVPGVLTNILVDRGVKVSKGQVLATLDDAAIAPSLNELKTQLELARTVYDKQHRLWEQKIGTEIQYLQAKANKEALERRLASLQEQVAMYRIKSPISGVVDEVVPNIGESVAPGMGIIRVVNMDKTKIIAEISEAYATRIQAGDEVIVQLPDTKSEFKSKVKVVSRAINPINRTFTIEAAVPANMPLRPNMIAVIKINDYTNPSTITVPVNLVQKDERDSYVLVAASENGGYTVRKKTVKTGKTTDGKVEILSGLATTDLVINSGYQDLNEGQKVAFDSNIAAK